MSPIDQTFDAIRACPVIVCIRRQSTVAARESIQAVLEGGLSLIEITLTTPGALSLIDEFRDDPRAVLGAGTVLSVEDADRVADVGGRFALSPVFDPEVVTRCADRDVLAVPGSATPTEMLRAYRGGARLIKVFPIGQLGGAPYLKVVRGPLPQIPLAATNGVTLQTLPDYFEAGVVAVGIGGAILFDSAEQTTLRARAFADAVVPFSS